MSRFRSLTLFFFLFLKDDQIPNKLHSATGGFFFGHLTHRCSHMVNRRVISIFSSPYLQIWLLLRGIIIKAFFPSLVSLVLIGAKVSTLLRTLDALLRNGNSDARSNSVVDMRTCIIRRNVLQGNFEMWKFTRKMVGPLA